MRAKLVLKWAAGFEVQEADRTHSGEPTRRPQRRSTFARYQAADQPARVGLVCDLDKPAVEQTEVAQGNKPYDVMAEKIGFVPNLRKWDNIFQAIVIAAFATGAAVVGFVWQGAAGAIIAAWVGLVAGLLVSGLMLCAIGLMRK